MSKRRRHRERSGRPAGERSAGGGRSAGGVAMFEVGGSPEFLAMIEGLGFEMCDTDGCDGMGCGRWHVG